MVFAAGGRVRQQGGLARVVVRKAAAGQQHAAAGVDLDRSIGGVQHRARHALAVAQQAPCRAAGADLDTRLEGRGGQPRDQGIAVDQPHAAAVDQQVFPVRQHALRDDPERSGLAHRVEKVAQLGARGDAHAPERGLGQRRLEVGNARAKAAAVERRGAERAAAGGRMGCAAVEIGNRVAVDELQGGLRAEELHHARRSFQECAGAGLVEALSEFVTQVGQRLFDGLVDAGLHRERIARQPHPATGPRGGAAVLRFLFGDDDFESEMGGGHGGRQPTGS